MRLLSPNLSLQAWLNSLDKIELLHAARIVPSHGEMGDGSLTERDRTYLKALQTRVAELKREGKTVEQASETVVAELKSKYPDWTGNTAAAVRSAYTEAR